MADVIKTENLTILFVDIAGFTATTSRQSRMENARLLQNFGTTLLPLIKNFKGRLIKTIGDALLITFRSPTDAMLCSMALQDAIHGYNLSASEAEKIHIRVAANLGEVRVTKNDIFGEPVNVTSRIEGVAPADEIYLSEAVYMAMNKAEVPAVEVGTKELAGVPHPVRLYNIPRFSTHRLVSENTGGEEQGSELVYPYGGMHYYHTRSRTLSSFLNFADNRKVANFFISALAVSVFAIAIVVGYRFINKPLSDRLAGKQTTTDERQPTAAIEPPVIQQQSKTEESTSILPGDNEETAQDNEIPINEADSEENVQIPAKMVTKSPIKKTAETPKVTSLASIETSSTKTEPVAGSKTTETSSTKTEPVATQQTTKTASTKTETVSGQKLLAGKDSSTLTPANNIISMPEKGPDSGPIELDIGETKSDVSKKEIGDVISAPITYASRRDTIDTLDNIDTTDKLDTIDTIETLDNTNTTDSIDTTDILNTTDWDVYKARQAYRQSKITAAEYNRIVRALQNGSMPSTAKKETIETIGKKDITEWDLIKAKQAYNQSKISKDDYIRIVRELKSAYDKKIDQLNLALKSGKISQDEYLEDVRKAKLAYKGE